jgi:hypothetical protein
VALSLDVEVVEVYAAKNDAGLSGCGNKPDVPVHAGV